MMNRRELLVLGGAMAVARPTLAQQKAMPVIGFLGAGSPGALAAFTAAFHDGLSQTGWVEGQNVLVEYRWAEGDFDRLPALAADLVDRKVDVIAAMAGIAPAAAARGATTTIPIVFSGGDPVGLGLVSGLARPGGNLTGVSSLDLSPKRVEMLSELVPGAKVIGLLINPSNPSAESIITNVQDAAHTKGVQLDVVKASTKREIDAAFTTLAHMRVGGLIQSSDALFNSWIDEFVALASRHAIPAIYDWREYPAAGGLISYGPSRTGIWRQQGIYVGKILKGAKPADLPVEQPTRFELVVNLKTAEALDLKVPPSILARADEVIE
jgi:putative ABC transport system substrate-binding protein